MSQATRANPQDAAPSSPALPARPVDRTLSPQLDANGRPIAPSPPFPDLGRGARLVLYPVRGGLAVDFDLAELDPTHALASFPDYPPGPGASLRLCRIGDGGRVEIADGTDIPGLGNDAERLPRGQHRFPQPGEDGSFQAELGLTTPGGGWVLLLRSNRIAVGVDQPPELRPATALVAAKTKATAAATATATQESSPTATTSPNVVAAHAAPNAIATTDSPTHPRNEGIGHVDRSPANLRTKQAEDPYQPHLARRQPEPERSSTQHTANAPQAPTPAPPGRVHAVHYLADGSGLIGPVPQSPTSTEAEHLGEADALDPVDEDATAERPSPHADTEPNTANAQRADTRPNPGKPTPPTPGSGPIPNFRDSNAIGVSAELIINGHAPPGTLLDLGGHPYRVGPGGRFQLRIPVPEHERIITLLRPLPELPVDERD